MDQSSGAGSVNPASVAASVKAIITHHTSSRIESNPQFSVSSRRADYRVADLFGRCFLRVCYWVEVLSSMRRRGKQLSYVPFPRSLPTSIPPVNQANDLVTNKVGETLPGASSVASA
jgi:hypothetical protein